jgi:hypothetical protein
MVASNNYADLIFHDIDTPSSDLRAEPFTLAHQ